MNHYSDLSNSKLLDLYMNFSLHLNLISTQRLKITYCVDSDKHLKTYTLASLVYRPLALTNQVYILNLGSPSLRFACYLKEFSFMSYKQKSNKTIYIKTVLSAPNRV